MLQGNSFKWVDGPKLGYSEMIQVNSAHASAKPTLSSQAELTWNLQTCIVATQLMPGAWSNWTQVACNTKMKMAIVCEGKSKPVMYPHIRISLLTHTVQLGHNKSLDLVYR